MRSAAVVRAGVYAPCFTSTRQNIRLRHHGPADARRKALPWEGEVRGCNAAINTGQDILSSIPTRSCRRWCMTAR